MREDINRLKTMIQKEVPSSYYVHCFAHRLQLVLISAAKNHVKVCWFFVELSSLCVTVSVSCKRADQFQELQAANIRDAMVGEEMKTCCVRLNQDLIIPAAVRDKMENSFYFYLSSA